jgi:hypothetical protein
LSPGGSGYLTQIQNMKLVRTVLMGVSIITFCACVTVKNALVKCVYASRSAPVGALLDGAAGGTYSNQWALSSVWSCLLHTVPAANVKLPLTNR